MYDAWGNHQVLVKENEEYIDISNNLDYTNNIGNVNPFRYRGYYFDTETSLYYLNTRYYDPTIGRFINADEITILDETSSDIHGLNLYMYCGNNPVMNVDPTGLSWWKFWEWDWAAIGAGALMLVTAVGAVALSIATFGAATPLAMAIVAGVTIIAATAVGVNGIAMIGEGISGGYNFMRDGVFGGNSAAYNTYASVVGGIMAVGMMVLGGYQMTGRAKATNIGRKHLGKGYTKEGPNRWVSKDKMRQLRWDTSKHSIGGKPSGYHFNLDSSRYPMNLRVKNNRQKTIHQMYKWFRTWVN